MISLQPVQTADIPQVCDELGKQAEFKRAFPLINRSSFHNSVLEGHQIQQGKDIAGFFLKTNPAPPFRIYSDRESLLMIYPAYQRQGIGTLALEWITEKEEKVLFVSSKSNPASTAFFQKQRLLNFVTENSRYRVYSS
jgi:GNAT superfamily N-acetyltransferase